MSRAPRRIAGLIFVGLVSVLAATAARAESARDAGGRPDRVTEGKSWAVTVRKNGVDTALTVTISGASQTYALDSSHSFTVAAGDEVEII